MRKERAQRRWKRITGLNEDVASLVEPVQVSLHFHKCVFGVEITTSEVAEVQECTECANYLGGDEVGNCRKIHL